MEPMTLAQASGIVDHALARARDGGFKPVTVAVLDAGGHLLALKREDGCGMLRVQIAQAKAWGALGMGVGSRALAARAAEAPAFFAALTDIAAGRIVPVAGGVLVRDCAGRVIGAVGISGDYPDNDEAGAVFGIEAVGFVADGG